MPISALDAPKHSRKTANGSFMGCATNSVNEPPRVGSECATPLNGVVLYVDPDKNALGYEARRPTPATQRSIR